MRDHAPENDRRNYPTVYSDMEVLFASGEVKTFRLRASPGLSPHLARQAGETGFLSVRDTDGSWHNFPVNQIEQFTLREVADGPQG